MTKQEAIRQEKSDAFDKLVRAWDYLNDGDEAYRQWSEEWCAIQAAKRIIAGSIHKLAPNWIRF